MQPINSPRIALVGLGAIGVAHFNSYGAMTPNPLAALVIAEPKKRAGDWSDIRLNLDVANENGQVDLSAYSIYESLDQTLADDTIDAVDICTPTKLHAAMTIAALRAGKHVFCEKPMAFTVEEARQVIEVTEQTGGLLMIGHCLRYDSHYVKAKALLDSGEFGPALYARFSRISATPRTSVGNWLRNQAQSGGVLLDMSIHDIDTALWWFGAPDQTHIQGVRREGLLALVDSQWHYEKGPEVVIHGAWDDNGRDFSMGFELVMEKATLIWDSSRSNQMTLFQDGQKQAIDVGSDSLYQLEMNDFVAHLRSGTPVEAVTPQSSLLTLQTTLNLLAQVG